MPRWNFTIKNNSCSVLRCPFGVFDHPLGFSIGATAGSHQWNQLVAGHIISAQAQSKIDVESKTNFIILCLFIYPLEKWLLSVCSFYKVKHCQLQQIHFVVPRQPVAWRAVFIPSVVTLFILHKGQTQCQWGLRAGTEAAGLSVRWDCVGIFSNFFGGGRSLRGVSWRYCRGQSMFDIDFRMFPICRWTAGVGRGKRWKAGRGRRLFFIG